MKEGEELDSIQARVHQLRLTPPPRLPEIPQGVVQNKLSSGSVRICHRESVVHGSATALIHIIVYPAGNNDAMLRCH